MNILKVTLKRNVLLAFCLLSGISTIAFAQKSASAQLSTRFAHAQFNAAARTYSIDIEMMSEGTAQQLFGMNLRFFYDAADLEFVSISDLHPSYQTLGAPPQAFKGNAASGSAMFNLEESAAYINGAIQLTKEDAPLEIPANQWTKIGKLNFSVPKSIPDGSRICPNLIWDLQAAAEKGGFFAGDNGLTVTVVEKDPKTREVSAPANIAVLPFNWEYTNTDHMPFGHPLNADCFSIGGVVSSSNEVTNHQGYTLYQNYPNPFADNTIIEFVLPSAQQARLVFCDVTGRVIHTIQGDYKAGQNAEKIERSVWPTQGSVLFYRLETAEYTSPVLKMTVVDR